jgi:hypothetical protein
MSIIFSVNLVVILLIDQALHCQNDQTQNLIRQKAEYYHQSLLLIPYRYDFYQN